MIVDDVLIEMYRSNFLNKIQVLNLKFTGVTDQGIIYLFKSPNCEQLRQLRLSWNRQITDATLIAIQEDSLGYISNLRKLYVNDTSVTNEGVKNFLQKCPLIELIYSYTISLMNKFEQSDMAQGQFANPASQTQFRFK